MTDTRTTFLRVEAPFAAFRWLQAGVYRGTFPVIPPSAAWGLALNLAGIETRGSVNEIVTPIRSDAPCLDIAVGLLHTPQRTTLYQQLHGYPVGSSGKELQARVHGQKYWIVPVRRELLVDFRCAIGVRGEAQVIERIAAGLAGTLAEGRYGLPFAGDNQLLFDRIEIASSAPQAQWFVPVAAGDVPAASTRLTVSIDRSDASRTRAPLFAATEAPCPCPDAAWVRVGPGPVAAR